MPNTYFIHYLSNLIATPEDADDSVMILMTNNAPDSTAQKLKLMMDSVANGQLHRIKNTYKKYKDIPAHSTYIGHKWGVDFDFSVHCNVLYFLLDKKIPFNKFDSATVNLIIQMVANREYMKDPRYISAYYFTSSTLLYHLARLMGQFNIRGLEQYKPQLINDLKELLPYTHNAMEDIIISTSLLRLGYQAESLPISLDVFNKSNQHQFVFYQAPAASQVKNPFKRLLLDFSLINYHFFCPAYNKVLLLEYLVERNKKLKKSS